MLRAAFFLPALVLAAAACGSSRSPASTPPPAPAAASAAPPSTIALPGAPADGVFLDYLAYDAAHHRVWVPAAGTGKVDVIDATTRTLTPIEGFATKEVERRGQKRTVGPTAASVGDGVVYIGNRGDSSICAFDAATLAKQGCATLKGSPDGVAYVAATKEVWVTTPRDKRIVILDASTPGAPTDKDAHVDFDGEPEGFAVDNARGVFFTNLEDKDKTLVVDLKTRAVTATYEPKCGDDGPKGLAFDGPTDHLVVVCPDHLETLDIAHGGAVLGTLAVGDGLDAIDYVASRHELFAAAGRAQKLVVARLEADGKITAGTTTATAKGARNAVAAEDGTAFVAVGPSGAVMVVPPQGK